MLQIIPALAEILATLGTDVETSSLAKRLGVAAFKSGSVVSASTDKADVDISNLGRLLLNDIVQSSTRLAADVAAGGNHNLRAYQSDVRVRTNLAEARMRSYRGSGLHSLLSSLQSVDATIAQYQATPQMGNMNTLTPLEGLGFGNNNEAILSSLTTKMANRMVYLGSMLPNNFEGWVGSDAGNGRRDSIGSFLIVQPPRVTPFEEAEPPALRERFNDRQSAILELLRILKDRLCAVCPGFLDGFHALSPLTQGNYGDQQAMIVSLLNISVLPQTELLEFLLNVVTDTTTRSLNTADLERLKTQNKKDIATALTRWIKERTEQGGGVIESGAQKKFQNNVQQTLNSSVVAKTLKKMQDSSSAPIDAYTSFLSNELLSGVKLTDSVGAQSEIQRVLANSLTPSLSANSDMRQREVDIFASSLARLAWMESLLFGLDAWYMRMGLVRLSYNIAGSQASDELHIATQAAVQEGAAEVVSTGTSFIGIDKILQNLIVAKSRLNKRVIPVGMIPVATPESIPSIAKRYLGDADTTSLSRITSDDSRQKGDSISADSMAVKLARMNIRDSIQSTGIN